MRITLLVLSVAFLLLLHSCGGCSRDARRTNQMRGLQNNARSETSASMRVTRDDRSGRSSAQVQMRKQGGVYFVPIEVNGTPMEFIFDTGASDICISLTEALFLIKQGTLTEKDILGVENYQIADGSIVEGTKIILRQVRIGNKSLPQVEASIVHNLSAPLLLGQSALARFGKISIDYNRNSISFD